MVVEEQKLQQPGINVLLKRLVYELSELIRQHIELFKLEIRDDALLAAKYTGIAVAGLLIASLSFIFFGFFLIFLLSVFIPLWEAALIVTLIYFVVAGIALFVAFKQMQNIKKGAEDTIGETQKTSEEAQKWFQELK